MNNILKIGALLKDRYKVIEILSNNTGFGITYKIKDSNHPNQPIRILKQLKKPTAAKLDIENLPIQQQEEILNQYWQEYLRLFRIETQALAKLGEDHKQIPTIFEYFDEQDEYFYVQEYIEGHSLSEEIKQGQKLSEPKTISLLIEILEVFEYIQTNPGYSVIHRDIKPENIIRKNTDHKLVVIDFGLAKEVTVPGTKIGSILGGTKGYIAPEITLGIVSFASDIYAIGMIGVFAVTGEDPTYTPLLDRNWQTKANVSPEFAAVLNQMICESYKQRFQNATEALAALRKLNNRPVPPPPPLKIKLPIKLITGFVLAVVVVIAVMLIPRKTDNQLIADGKQKQGQLTTADQKELASDKIFDAYEFKRGCLKRRLEVAAATVNSNGTQWLNYGIQLWRINNTDNAIKAMENAVIKDPTSWQPYYNVSLIWLLQGKYDLALNAINTAISKPTVFYRSYLLKGFIFQSLKEYENAIEALNQAILELGKEKQTDFLLYQTRGQLFGELKKYQEAIADFTQAITINPQDAETYYNRGVMYSEQGKTDLAIADFTQSIAINPLDAKAYHNSGFGYEKLGKTDLAIADFTQSIAINPLDGRAYYRRAVTYTDQGKLYEAIEDLNKYITIKPQDVNAYFLRGFTYLSQNKKQQGVQDLETVVQLYQQQGDIQKSQTMQEILNKL